MPAPLSTLAAQVTPAGITAPDYDAILASLQASFQGIYGSDAYVGVDSQDGQLLAIFAKAIHDANTTLISVYNSFSPSTASAVALSSLVKINGISRAIASNSQADLTIIGTVGTTLTNAQARDTSGVLWDIPTSTIPSGGVLTVTATCHTDGAVAAATGTITKIATPTFGWVSVTNAAAATLGDPVESDAALRRRQAKSVGLPAETITDGLRGALLALTGVSQVTVYENATNATDGNGVPAHSIACVVDGGSNTDIGQAILTRKTPGTGTFGSSSVVVHDAFSTAYTINYSTPAAVAIKVAISLHALTGYTSAVADSIKQSLADYVNALPIGDDVLYSRLYVPALLGGSAPSFTYEITVIQIALLAGTLGTTDIVVGYNQQAALSVANVTITVV